ncbi:MAG: protein kinase, partial [Cyanobacteria bacterium J06560_5]
IIHKDIKPDNILIHPETSQIKLIDFSIACLLTKERKAFMDPGDLEGTLAYMAPEQTGRMNRGIDYRSDFYAFGITLYELLTGELPFSTEGETLDGSGYAIALIHSHLTTPLPIAHEINADIPPILSEILTKLTAKNAEDRYQSALGLKHDLEECLYQLKDWGHVDAFELGSQDVCDRFLLPEKLYGRQIEVARLLAAFERTSQGSTEIM